MKVASYLFAALIFSLGGCATAPVDPAVQSAMLVSDAKDQLISGNKIRGGDLIDTALRRPTGGSQVAAMFLQFNAARGAYLANIQARLEALKDPLSANNLFDIVSLARDAKAITANEAESLLQNIRVRVSAGNLSGVIPFNLKDDILAFPELTAQEHQNMMVKRSIANVQRNESTRDVESLMNFAAKYGNGSPQFQLIEQALPSMEIRRSEIPIVAKVYPAYASIRTEQTMTKVNIQIKGADRLLADDILTVLKQRIYGVDWTNSTGQNVTNLVIERIRNEEKTLPERSETITYSQYEVNLISAALLMPRNASYLYEVISGGAEIDYGYAVTAILNGKTTFDEIVRGKSSGTYKKCQNARIQNVFGGVSSAGFIANDQMQSICNGASEIRLDDLRKVVFEEIATSVLKVPAIATTHALK